jgi:NADPH-dependent 2,4-dienoyl-CoA reductase/sulfur reductase-like enzyme
MSGAVASTGHIAVVGGSLAGIRAAEALRRGGHDGPITLVGAEAHLPYDRPPLSKQVLAGSMAHEQTMLQIDDAVDVDMRLSTRAAGLDLERRAVLLEGGEELLVDGLVIATGAHPRVPRGFPELEGVFVLRTLDDCLSLRKAVVDGSPRLVVVGAGFIGSEVAATCHSLGVDVTVVEALPVPMVRAIGEKMGRACAALHADNGVAVQLGVGVDGLDGDGRVESVRLADGTAVAADLVVIGIGVAPTTAWLDESGLDLADGVVCDQWCRALSGGRPLPWVVAAGDVARWHHPAYGEAMRVEHWTNAIEQAEAAATALLRGEEAEPFSPVPYFWSDQYGTKIQFVGRTEPDDQVQIVEGSVEERKFVAAFGRDGRTVAALSFNRPPRIMKYRAMLTTGVAFPPPVP